MSSIGQDLKYDDSTASELFHENSKQQRSDYRMVERIIAMITNPLLQKMAESRKRYPAARKVSLPKDLPKAKISFDEVVLSRRSTRNYTGESIPFAEICKILYFANGVTGSVEAHDGLHQLFRTAPSGGALYPVEIYLFAFQIKKLEPGVYHYDPVENVLEYVAEGDYRPALITTTFTEELASAGAVIALTGISIKNRVKYAERGYRFMLMEAGHIAQNILLCATSLQLGAFPIGGFIDDEMDTLLGIDGLDEVSLYLIALGRV